MYLYKSILLIKEVPPNEIVENVIFRRYSDLLFLRYVQAQGAWQKGANKVENKGMDGYGIVKTDKSMQKPSNVRVS